MSHLRRSEWVVANIASHGECVAMIAAWHYAQGAPNTSVARHGLFRDGLFEPCRGVAMWLPPTRSAGEAIAGDDWRGVLSLTRFVIEPEMPTNAASFLLSHSRKLIDRDRWPISATERFRPPCPQGHSVTALPLATTVIVWLVAMAAASIAGLLFGCIVEDHLLARGATRRHADRLGMYAGAAFAAVLGLALIAMWGLL